MTADRDARATPPRPDATLAVPGLTFAFSATIQVDAPIELGLVDGVRRRVIPIVGGHVSGPRLEGEVMSGGADWQSIRADGSADIRALYTIRATDGTILSIENVGVRRGPPAILASLAAGEEVDPALYYFRTTPRFTVGEGPHRWLAESVFVATGARFPDRVLIDVFALG